MQRRTRTTLFLDSTGLLKRLAFALLEKIARVANVTLSRSFCEYRLLNRLRLAMANRFAMVATLPFYYIVRLRYYVYLVTVIPLVYLFASQHCCSTFTKIVTPGRLTFNLTRTVSYGRYGTHVVIYIPVFAQ